MAEAWSAVVTREPEWDDYSVSRVLALAVWESRRCPNCQNYDSLVPLPKKLRHVTWSEHDGHQFVVEQYRCMACGAADIVKRDWAAEHEKDKPITGTAAPGDGLMFVTRPLTETE